MRCPECSTENAAGRKFCAECGAQLSSACPSCGSANDPGAKFCGECGTAIGAPARVEPPVGAARSATPAPSAAERRIVSILFVDLVGFTALTEGRDPEVIRDLQERYFATTRTIVDRYGGTLEKYIGDAVMAVWGAPTAFEDDPERAVRAALDVVSSMTAIGFDDGPTLVARAAVMTGEAAVTIGAVGQGMVSGELVSAASRLQGAAPEGGVLIDEPTHRATASAIAATPAGDQSLRGRSEPLAAWRATGVVARRGGGGRVDRLEPPFVGRDSELRLLKDVLHAVADESRARLVSITGIAGIGKSRLAWELEKYIDGIVSDVYWHQGRSPAYGEGIAFWALAEMVRSRAGIAEGESAEATQQKLSTALTEYVPDETERRTMIPWLLALFGLQEARENATEEAFAAARLLMERIAARGVAVFVFEDLQWADDGLIDFIESVLEWSRNHRILIVTLARPELLERRPTWGAGQRNFTALHLEPLSDGAMTQILDGVAPGLPRPFVRRIVERAAGIPLFAVETIRMLLDDGRLVRDDDVYRLAGEVGELSVPESLRGLVIARLDGLDTDDRALIQDAAVLGQTFTLDALAALTGRSVDALSASLRSLVRREILTLDADPRSPERGQYGFVQAVIREVAYETLARKERRARHLAAARYLETLDNEELAGVLASHYVDAYQATPAGPEADALAAQARVALRGAAERASALGSHASALGYLEKALTVTTDPAERTAVWEAAATAGFRAARFDVAERYGRQALEASMAAGDTPLIARSAIVVVQPLFAVGRTAEATEILESAVSACADQPDLVEVVTLRAEQARGMMMANDLVGLETIEGVLVDAERLRLIPTMADALVTKAGLLDLVGRNIEGVALLRGAIELSATHGLVNTELRAGSNLANQTFSDDPRAGLQVATEFRERSRSLGLRENFRWLTWSCVGGYLTLGGFEEVRHLIVELEEADLADFDTDAVYGARAMVAAYRGHADEAAQLRAAEEAAWPDISRPDFLVGRWFEKAIILSLAGELDAAYTEAMAGAGIVPYVLCPAVASRCAAWLGDPDRARAAHELVAASVERGRFVDTLRISSAAGLAALEDRREEAIAGFREASTALRDLDATLDLGLTLLDYAVLIGPGDAGARAAAEEARAVFERLGCPPLLERLSVGLERWDSGTGTAPSEVADDVVRTGGSAAD